MRGRTNITQGSGNVLVNGDIKEYKVATGNTISVGDFVTMIPGPGSYYDTPSSSTMINPKYQSGFKVSENKCALFYDKNIMILDLSNGIVLDKIISGSFQSVSTGNIYQIDNTHFAILYDGGASNYVYSLKIDVLELDVENGLCSFVTKICSVDVSDLTYAYFSLGENSSYILDGVLFIQDIYSVYKSGVYTREYAIAWFDINSNKSGLYKFENPDNYIPYKDIGGYCCWSHDDVGNIYVFYKMKSSEDITYVNVNKLNFSLENESLQFVGKYQMNTGHEHYYYNANILFYIGDNNFALSCKDGVEILNVNNGITLLNYITSEYGTYSPYYPGISIFGNYLLIFQRSSGSNNIEYQAVIGLSDIFTVEKFEFQKFDIAIIYGSLRTFECFVFLDFIDKFLLIGEINSSGNVLRLFECKVENGNIVGMDSENYVALYNGKALGFAKTGGTAGETIKVYVPHENN